MTFLEKRPIKNPDILSRYLLLEVEPPGTVYKSYEPAVYNLKLRRNSAMMVLPDNVFLEEMFQNVENSNNQYNICGNL